MLGTYQLNLHIKKQHPLSQVLLFVCIEVGLSGLLAAGFVAVGRAALGRGVATTTLTAAGRLAADASEGETEQGE